MGRPIKDFFDFNGQPGLIELFKRWLAGCKHTGGVFPSCMLIGQSGSGKTALAEAVARAFGTEIHPIFAGSGIKPIEICRVLAEVKYGDFVFIDEIHSLDRECQQLLYLALDKQQIPRISGSKLVRTTTEPIAQFTLIVATNIPGKIQKALATRLKRLELEPYLQAELRAIAERIALKYDVTLSGQAITKMAETSQGIPRHLDSRIATLKLFWPGVTQFSIAQVNGMLASEGIGKLGTTSMQRRYLELLMAVRNGCSLSRIAAQLGCDVPYIRDSVEPFLAQLGYIEFRGGQGRTITPEGRKFISPTDEAIPDAIKEEGESTCLPS